MDASPSGTGVASSGVLPAESGTRWSLPGLLAIRNMLGLLILNRGGQLLTGHPGVEQFPEVQPGHRRECRLCTAGVAPDRVVVVFGDGVGDQVGLELGAELHHVDAADLVQAVAGDLERHAGLLEGVDDGGQVVVAARQPGQAGDHQAVAGSGGGDRRLKLPAILPAASGSTVGVHQGGLDAESLQLQHRLVQIVLVGFGAGVPDPLRWRGRSADRTVPGLVGHSAAAVVTQDVDR